jgi:hypothetical protein
MFPFTKTGNQPVKAPEELVAREGKYPPSGIKFPSQATLAWVHCNFFAEKSRFLAISVNSVRL